MTYWYRFSTYFWKAISPSFWLNTISFSMNVLLITSSTKFAWIMLSTFVAISKVHALYLTTLADDASFNGKNIFGDESAKIAQNKYLWPNITTAIKNDTINLMPCSTIPCFNNTSRKSFQILRYISERILCFGCLSVFKCFEAFKKCP